MKRASSTLRIADIPVVGWTTRSLSTMVRYNHRSPMSRNTQLPTPRRCWRHYFFTVNQRSADPRNRLAARDGARHQTPSPLTYRCLAGATRTYALPVNATARRCQLRSAREGHQVHLRKRLPSTAALSASHQQDLQDGLSRTARDHGPVLFLRFPNLQFDRPLLCVFLLPGRG